MDKLQSQYKEGEDGRNALFQQQSTKINQQEAEIRNNQEQLDSLQKKLESAEEQRKQFIKFAESSLSCSEAAMQNDSTNGGEQLVNESLLKSMSNFLYKLLQQWFFSWLN